VSPLLRRVARLPPSSALEMYAQKRNSRRA
jgi:hypothetical protein